MTDRDSPAETSKTAVERYWAGRADEYDSDGISGIHSTDQRDAWLDRLRAWTGEHPRDVLDVGCGTGVISLLLSDLGHNVTGVDIAAEMIDRARSKADSRELSAGFCIGDAVSLPFPDDRFDVLTARCGFATSNRPSRFPRTPSRRGSPS
ncbi:methyltransferase type 11 [Halalkaliarchaeum desulfuricum]|uniref:Methyltransferase type 11 n=1 Tax=Halalkaliarchaeum desulfuricum TaxID=2055893 RepID=A0A343TNC9_9EURY|nr:class I SAM-dependent methyltransferase [Halalkaliarchaeum desulfuricum]AUX10601.1 methyltransferase type 11 [Halalkaliarchaeum desulfuricum]